MVDEKWAIRKRGECRPKQIDAAPTQRIKTLDEVEKEHIMHVLEKCGGRKEEAAKLLGIDCKTRFRKMNAFMSG